MCALPYGRMSLIYGACFRIDAPWWPPRLRDLELLNRNAKELNAEDDSAAYQAKGLYN